MNSLLSTTHPGGLFIAFAGMIDRKAAEQIAFTLGDGARQGYQIATLLMTSSGGLIEFGFYAANLISALPISVITYNVGDVASTGNLIFLAGTQRFACEGSTFFFHQTHAGAPPEGITNSVLRNRIRAFKLSDDRICKFVANRTGKSIKEAERWHRNSTHMDVKQALANGVIHGVQAPSIPANAYFHQIVL